MAVVINDDGSVTLSGDELDFVETTLSNARDLMDNTHCYDTQEFKDCAIANSILGGATLEEAIEAEEHGDDYDEDEDE